MLDIYNVMKAKILLAGRIISLLKAIRKLAFVDVAYQQSYSDLSNSIFLLYGDRLTVASISNSTIFSLVCQEKKTRPRKSLASEEGDEKLNLKFYSYAENNFAIIGTLTVN